jgi:hypothetical protein
MSRQRNPGDETPVDPLIVLGAFLLITMIVLLFGVSILLTAACGQTTGS